MSMVQNMIDAIPAQLKQKAEKINNTQLLADTGLRIRHFHNSDRFGYPRVRDMTVAYREGRSNIEIATAVVHPTDCFSRKMGTKLAIESFLAGKTIRVPKTVDFYDPSRKAASAQHTLTLMFG